MTDTLPEAPIPPHGATGHTGGILHLRVKGIPVIPVVGVSAAAIIGYYVWKKRGGKSTATAASVDTTTPNTGADNSVQGATEDGFANLGGGAAYDGFDQLTQTSGGVDGGTATTTSLATSNQQWGVNAINGLTGQGQYAPLDIQNAIAAEINGNSLTALQQQIVNAAIAAYGEPPGPITGTTLPSGTATVTSGYHPYTTKAGDTVASVLQATYNQVDPVITGDFFAVNTNILHSDGHDHIYPGHNESAAMKPGQTLHLPIFTAGTLP